MTSPFHQRYVREPKSAVAPRAALPAGEAAPAFGSTGWVEARWKAAAPLGKLVAAQEAADDSPKKRPRQPTEVRLAFDDQGVYVAWRAAEPEPQNIKPQSAPDTLGRPDYHYENVDLLFDFAHDHARCLALNVGCDVGTVPTPALRKALLDAGAVLDAR